MSLDAQVKQYLTTDIPEGRSSLSKSHKDLRSLSEHCHREIARQEDTSVQTTQVYAAQSLASVAYQINTLAGQLVDLLKLQCDQWGELEHQISDINQQFNFYEEKHSRHLIGKFTTEKPVHLMRRVNPPAQKEAPTKYERHPINFTVWDHIGHGSPTRDSVPAADSPPKKTQAKLMSHGQDRRSLLTHQATSDDIYGTSFDAMRYHKKPVAHAIPIAHAIPRTETMQDTERDFTATSELFTQGHTTDSLYDSLAHIPGEQRPSDSSEKQPLTASISDTFLEPEFSMLTPSPLGEALSPTLSDAPHQLSPPPPEEPEQPELAPEPAIDNLDQDLYPHEEFPSPTVDLLPPPPSPPPPEPIEAPKPPRPANPAPTRPVPPSSDQLKRPPRSAPGIPPSASVYGPPSSSPPPPPTSSVPSRPAPPSGATVRPTRPAPPPGAAVTTKLSAPTTNPPPPPFVDDPNVPAPPPDMPGPIVADPRVPAPPPNIPKDGVVRTGTKGSTSDASASPVKKSPPKPAPKGFDPSDILNMKNSLKKKGALRPGATIDIPTESVTLPPKKTSLVDLSTQSVPLNFPLPTPAPADTGTAADKIASIPEPPSDIPEGWNKKPLGAAKSEPGAKKSAPPKAQPPKSAAFDPSQILQRKLRSSQGSSSSAPGESTDTGSAPPNYLDKVETIYPYKAQKEDELNFGKGKIIYVLKKNPDGWYEGYMDGVRGLFPENYVKSID